MSKAKIRLCVDQQFGQGQSVRLSEAQAHYLFGVMRARVGSRVLLFNGRDGEWSAEIAEAGKRKGALTCLEQTRPQSQPPDLWLIFAPVKKARTDIIVEKAVELGVARLLPVTTEFTNSERLRRDRAEVHAREAAEQCGAVHVPTVENVVPLTRLLSKWDPVRRILWADEELAGEGKPPAELLAGRPKGPWAILIGPEGGFSEGERARLRALPWIQPMALGPRTLRAETAAIAAISLWQAHLGDWAAP
ncbi:Ribosomal RNA small subunit methyltransferase E [Defluviimonas aquaemixtae]|uniref:Ribosomal RNA small subunit methyltransferase E n=1 Tax=Albidovulum aquaemixtae TaxID=1542388 RepID=A0A2R8BJ53_9RHOB|nr:16S rRNA (uracil(1498)-N(3))-methyltransferase [Defluviimonas aquaemixtae]SPH23403.1 Ribosomal RNA small subunit methyltransferase E [Defluviimonas aquaemixtae]